MIEEPFCWLSLRAMRKLRTLSDDRGRKAATLLYVTLAELAEEARDREHRGFTAGNAEVIKACGLHRNTVYAARDTLVELGLLEVEVRQGSAASVWRLVPSDSARACTPTVHEPSRVNTEEKQQEIGLLRSPVTGGPVTEVFEHWRKVVPGKSRHALTPGRRSKIQTRLKEFSVEDLKRAIDQAARDPFLNGDNDREKSFTDFKTIFRNREKVEELLEDAARPPRQRAPAGRAGRASVSDLLRKLNDD
jgi:hypothetical protein